MANPEIGEINWLLVATSTAAVLSILNAIRVIAGERISEWLEETTLPEALEDLADKIVEVTDPVEHFFERKDRGRDDL